MWAYRESNYMNLPWVLNFGTMKRDKCGPETDRTHNVPSLRRNLYTGLKFIRLRSIPFPMGSASLVEARIIHLGFLDEFYLLPGMGVGQTLCGGWLGRVRAAMLHAACAGPEKPGARGDWGTREVTTTLLTGEGGSWGTKPVSVTCKTR